MGEASQRLLEPARKEAPLRQPLERQMNPMMPDFLRIGLRGRQTPKSMKRLLISTWAVSWSTAEYGELSELLRGDHLHLTNPQTMRSSSELSQGDDAR
ncbi:hypothetical protein C2S51_022148 [Perilla frutescens var. frutescens]|nr:hypothetical protein C2S51_022148 [Perilla frutescens var. frutescens]